MDNLELFLNSLIEHQLFKILPMREDNNPSLSEYVDSLLIELKGARKMYFQLNTNVEFIRIINTLSFFCMNDYSVKQCRREVFKMINLAKKIYNELIGE